MKKIAVFDVEVAPNRAMVGFMDVETGKVKQFEHDESKKIKKYLKKYKVIGFNSLNYDCAIVTAMMQGKSAGDIYEISKDLIDGDAKRWDYPNRVDDHIDLMEVAPGQASLKLYGARMNTKKLQDLPYSPHEKHSKKMWSAVCRYNVNDLILTKELYESLKPQLDLRAAIGEKYGIDVMSKGEAQIATAIYDSMIGLKSIPKQKPPRSVRYKAPAYIKFKSENLKELKRKLEKEVFKINYKNGSPILPDWMKEDKVIVDDLEYAVQIGGIHSKNNKTVIECKSDDEIIIDTDVKSLYPSLMIQNGFYPKQLGDGFGDLFKEIYERRQKAKAMAKKIKEELKRRGL